MISTILSTLFQFYDTIFGPILSLGPYISMGIFAGMLALLFSLLYWKLLDKEKADKIREKLNKKQEKMKEARKEDNDEEPGKYMEEILELNQKFMMTNMKPMIATMFFVALIFPWLGATYSPNIGLTPVENQTGTYQGEMKFAEQTNNITVINETENSNNTTIIIDDTEYQLEDRFEKYGVEWHIRTFQENPQGLLSTTEEPKILGISAEFIQLPFSIPIAGTALNWLGFYIILAMPLTYTFRKLLGVA